MTLEELNMELDDKILEGMSYDRPEVENYKVTFKKGEFENNVTKVTVDHKNKKVVLG